MNEIIKYLTDADPGIPSLTDDQINEQKPPELFFAYSFPKLFVRKIYERELGYAIASRKKQLPDYEYIDAEEWKSKGVWYAQLHFKLKK